MLGRELPWVCERRTMLRREPPWVCSQCTMLGIHLLVYTARTPSWVHLPPSRSGTRHPACWPGSRFTALAQRVTERRVTDSPLTVSPLTVTRFTVGQCCTDERYVSNRLIYKGREGQCGTDCSPILYPFHCSACCSYVTRLSTLVRNERIRRYNPRVRPCCLSPVSLADDENVPLFPIPLIPVTSWF